METVRSCPAFPLSRLNGHLLIQAYGTRFETCLNPTFEQHLATILAFALSW